MKNRSSGWLDSRLRQRVEQVQVLCRTVCSDFDCVNLTGKTEMAMFVQFEAHFYTVLLHMKDLTQLISQF